MDLSQKGFIQLPIIISIFAGLLVLGGAGYFGLSEFRDYQAEQEEKEANYKTLIAEQGEKLTELQEDQDVCINIEGIQNTVPEGMTVDESGSCSSPTEIVEKIVVVEKPVIVETPPPPAEVKEEDEEIIVDVTVIQAQSFDETRGYNQLPATVGYKFTNRSDKAASIDSIIFDIDAIGSHGISLDETVYSVTEQSGSKSPGYILPGSGKTFYSLNESLTIEPKSSKTLFVNVWGFTGFLSYGAGQKTIFKLKEVNSVAGDVRFNLGSPSGIVTTVFHTL